MNGQKILKYLCMLVIAVMLTTNVCQITYAEDIDVKNSTDQNTLSLLFDAAIDINKNINEKSQLNTADYNKFLFGLFHKYNRNMKINKKLSDYINSILDTYQSYSVNVSSNDTGTIIKDALNKTAKFEFEFSDASGEGWKKSHIYKVSKNSDKTYNVYFDVIYSDDFSGQQFVKKAVAVMKKNPESIFGYTMLSLSFNNANLKAFSTITASSNLKSAGSKKYTPNLIMDNDVHTAWVEGVKGSGIGQWIKFSSKKPQKVSGIEYVNGYSASNDLYKKNNRPAKIRIEFSDGTSIIKKLYDAEDYDDVSNLSSVIFFDKEVITNYIKITILEVYKGTKYDDTCISEICPLVW